MKGNTVDWDNFTSVGATAGSGRTEVPSASQGDDVYCQSQVRYDAYIGTFRCNYKNHAAGTLHRNWQNPQIQHVWSDQEAI